MEPVPCLQSPLGLLKCKAKDLFPIHSRITHAHWIGDTVKLFFLLAYSLGLAGTVVAAYGFAFYARGLGVKKRPRIYALPALPRSADIFPYYAYDLSKFLETYIRDGLDAGWHQVKLKIRRHLSVAAGMLLISIGFMIQIVLQFF